MKYLIALCLFVCVLAQPNHPPNNNDNTHHHPHPGGDIHCNIDSDCPDCGNDNTVRCIDHWCRCVSAKKRSTCHGSGSCPICPDGSHGVCNNQGHCECGGTNCHNGHQCQCTDNTVGVCNNQGHCDCGINPVGKRAGETCTTADDCPDCDHGNKVCEKHNEHEGHCHCKH